MSGRIEEDAESKKLLRKYKETMRTKALDIILRTLPKKVMSLDEALKTDARLTHTCAEIDTVFREDMTEARRKAEEAQKKREETEAGETAPKKRKLADSDDKSEETEKGTVKDAEMFMPSNRLVVESTDFLRKELLEVIDNFDTVKLWIQLNIPRIEDGNNFGVSVQEDTVSEVSRAEDNAFALLEVITKYYIARAKLVTKCFKYPNLADFETAVSEVDQKQYLNTVLSVVDLRNNYALIYDMVIKNMDKLENPRSSEHMSHLF